MEKGRIKIAQYAKKWRRLCLQVLYRTWVHVGMKLGIVLLESMCDLKVMTYIHETIVC